MTPAPDSRESFAEQMKSLVADCWRPEDEVVLGLGDPPHWRRIQFSDFMPVGKAYVIQLEDRDEPAKIAITKDAGFRMERPKVPTLVLNRRTLFP